MVKLKEINMINSNLRLIRYAMQLCNFIKKLHNRISLSLHLKNIFISLVYSFKKNIIISELKIFFNGGLT